MQFESIIFDELMFLKFLLIHPVMDVMVRSFTCCGGYEAWNSSDSSFERKRVMEVLTIPTGT